MTTYISQDERYGYDFIAGDFLPEGRDEYYLRDKQLDTMYKTKGGRKPEHFRPLTPDEITILIQNRNIAARWDDIFVSGGFTAAFIRDNFFAGRVRIGANNGGLLRCHDYTIPAGITNSRIISCDIGDNCAIHDCAYVSHYIIGDNVILSSINELDTTNHAKFGEGIIKEGEDEAVRVWIEPVNESGGRGVLPFAGMICADAYLWVVHREDKELIEAFKRITQNSVDHRRGYYGEIGHGTVIKHCKTLKDLRIGEGAYIKGANKLKNLTIRSEKKSPTQIGEGVELVNGIIGNGSRVFYGSKAVRFVLGNNCALKYGARLIHSILGDNSTISCCEVLNNLVFPAHEQHHNNSFLIASMIKGQSNLAAGSTIGSNHNSRGNDGEIIAGRGFWAGLLSALKHNSRFAGFTMITKGNYPFELDIPLPFCMLTNNSENTQRVLMPAYWWMYNMYALERNSWKTRERDKRVFAEQYIETDYLAPDTAAEIIEALLWLESRAGSIDDEDKLTTPCRLLERSGLPVIVIKVRRGMAAYREMLLYYAVKTLAGYFSEKGGINITGFAAAHPEDISLEWENLGGQLVPRSKVEALRTAIRGGKLLSWEAVHGEYRRLLSEYPLDKALNALGVLRFLRGGARGGAAITGRVWNAFLDEAARIRRRIGEQVYATKLKDYHDPFRGITYSGAAEQNAVLGRIEDNPLLAYMGEESERLFGDFAKARCAETEDE
jgi:NDP-sugar pyrophosphorylase family protein